VPSILSNLPFESRDNDLRDLEGVPIRLGRAPVRVKAYQIVVWVGISPSRWALDQDAPRIPAIVDTGHSDYFSIQADHLLHWAGLHPDALTSMSLVNINNVAVPRRAAIIWLQPNLPNHRGLFLGKPAFRLADNARIAVYPEGGQDPTGREYPKDYPRLPVLGMRALAVSRLKRSIDFSRNRVSLRTPGRLWW
jgi:hypothetical protein